MSNCNVINWISTFVKYCVYHHIGETTNLVESWEMLETFCEIKIARRCPLFKHYLYNLWLTKVKKNG